MMIHEKFRRFKIFFIWVMCNEIIANRVIDFVIKGGVRFEIFRSNSS